MQRISVAALILLLGAGCSPFNRAANQITNATSSATNTAQQAADVASGAAAIALKNQADRNLAIAQAHVLYTAAIAEGKNLTNGPCLANPVAAIPSWVVDLVHNPRNSTDDEAQNQCSKFRDRSAKHFVELDLSGNLVRAQ